jgi:hypothetical protein
VDGLVGEQDTAGHHHLLDPPADSAGNR